MQPTEGPAQDMLQTEQPTTPTASSTDSMPAFVSELSPQLNRSARSLIPGDMENEDVEMMSQEAQGDGLVHRDELLANAMRWLRHAHYSLSIFTRT